VRKGIAVALAALLVAVAGYCAYVVVVVIVTRHGKHYTPSILWTAIAIISLIAVASLWGALRIYRRRI
jgi:hypothetical protein